MELAKISSKGQITIPVTIRNKLRLKEGDKIAFIELDDQIVLANPLSLAIRDIQDAFSNEAERLNLKNEDDVVSLVKSIRAEKKVKINENNA
jgi:AbrB family looped-hinge helix DNA binding protein